jgi:DNA polymerase elongation subunit (family B)
VWTIFDRKEAALVLCGLRYFHELELSEIGILSFDIETPSLKRDENSRVLLISCTFRKGEQVIRKLFAYDEYPNQATMLKAWCAWVRSVDPSIILGHNIYGFDLPYLLFVAHREGVTLELGRDGSALQLENYKGRFRKDGSQFYSYQNPHIYGREVIDTMFLSMKADTARKYVSYGLKQIIQQEGLEKADRQHYDASQIGARYLDPVEWMKIKAYAQHDADDALALFDLIAAPYFYLTRMIPKPFQSIICQASGSQINSYLVSQYLTKSHSIPEASKPADYEGAISIGNPGRYSHVIKFDVASLYPSIMLEWGVQNREKDPEGHFLKMLLELTTERLKNKALDQSTGERHFKALSDSQKMIASRQAKLGRREYKRK